MQAHDLARAHLGADGDRAGLGVRADQPAHEEVALDVVGLVAVDDDAQQQPAGDELALLLGELVDRLAQLLERGLAGELADDVALGRRDGQLGADRRRALRDARQQLDAVEAHADGARVDDLVAVEQHRAVVGRARGGRRRRAPAAAASRRRGSAARRRSGRRTGRRAGSRRPRRRGRAGPTARRSPPRAPRPWRGTARLAVVAERGGPDRRRRSRPRPRARRRARRRRRSRSASRGASISWTASSVASGAARCAPEANTTARSQEPLARARGPPRTPPRARPPERRASWRGRCRCGRSPV